jgi:hypothetical protein
VPIVLAIAAVVVVGAGSTSAPQTATGWLDAFTAAVARDPEHLCSQLVTGDFRAALERDVHQPCVKYYQRVRPIALRVLRILATGTTAAVEIRYWPHGGYATFVLNQHAGSWQAVAIIPSGPLPVA